MVNEETKEIQAGINSIERKTRWLHLLHFSNRYADDIIKEVYGEDVDPNGQDYNFAENLIKDQTRSYKLMVIKKMLVCLVSAVITGIATNFLTGACPSCKGQRAYYSRWSNSTDRFCSASRVLLVGIHQRDLSPSLLLYGWVS